MQLPPELNEYWKNYSRNNPGRSLSNAEIEQLNQQFAHQKRNAEDNARQQRRNLELYQQKWEEISGSNTQAPEYMPQYGEKHELGSAPMISHRTRQFLQKRATELKRRQSRMNYRQQMDNAGGWAKPNKQNNAGPQMQNPFQF